MLFSLEEANAGLLYRGTAPVSPWVPPTELPDPDQLPRFIALDTETRDGSMARDRGPGWCYPDEEGYIVGVSVAWRDEAKRLRTMYLPIKHPNGFNFPRAGVVRWVRDLLSNPRRTVVVHNYQYDIGWMLRDFGIWPTSRVLDTMTMAPLLNEYRSSYSLDNLGIAYGIGRKDETLLKQALQYYGFKENDKKNLWKLPAQYAGPYAERDAGLTYRLAEIFAPLLEAEDLMNVFNLETRVLPVLVRMRERGMRVDIPGAEALRVEWLAARDNAVSDVYRMTGHRIDLNKPDTMEKLFAEIGRPLSRTTQGRWSMTKDFLATVDHPVAEIIRVGRSMDKLIGTFIDGYILKAHVKGRIYPELNPLPMGDDGGAVTGRMSSSNPNAQNLPGDRTKAGIQYRRLMLPEDGEVWASNDYSQQEPRILVDVAAKTPGCKGAWAAVRSYRNDPSTDFHNFVCEVAGQIERDAKGVYTFRKKAKEINLAVMYGQGSAATAKKLGLPTKWVRNRHDVLIEVAGDEAQAILDLYNQKLPFVQDISKKVKKSAETKGYIRTLMGRRCRFQRFDNGELVPETADFGFPYKALNRYVQGSAADQTKMAMAFLYENHNVIPLMQVHDELDTSSPTPEYAHDVIAAGMRDALPLLVPTKVDVACGPTWGATLDG